ncbi:hypothetical protein FFLO_02455 [Filobasidium floriforme]|uniref:Pectate lyase n=1 Tax=Filobasidium floriforme TaxID=5210 RepID=A0A8K0JSR9_9TREE|nr:hypothetical protein FFLO_02455 [Filobasidium floriforme]
MRLSFIAIASVLMTMASAASSPDAAASIAKRATFPIPASKGSVTYKEPKIIKAGQPFDGLGKTYGRGVKCTGQDEGGDADAVFILENGAVLKNAIIGADQIEGVHCKGACTIQNVWWSNVCEDALSLKGNGDATIIGGGAQGADDKIIQHNGVGTVTIDGFYASDFGKLYRSCGNCKEKSVGTKTPKRNVIVKNVKAFNGKVLTGINSNFGDTSTITNTCATSVKEICNEYQGNTNGKEPPKISSGVSKACKYTNPLPKC